MPNAEETAVLDSVMGEAPVVEPPKDKPKDTKAEKELLNAMMFSPSASDADPTLELESSTDIDEEEKDTKELLKILEKGEGKISEKYQKELLEKALKDPMSVEVETPRGWMTVREAIEQGFDMVTGEFSNEEIPTPDWEGSLAQLDPREQDTIRQLTRRDTPQAGLMPEGTELPMGEEEMPEEGAPVEGMPEELVGGLEGVV